MGTLQAGAKAPDFDFRLESGEVISSADFSGKRVLLIFLRHLA